MDEQQPTSFSRLSLYCCVVKLTRPRIAAFALSVLGALCLGFVFVVVLISTLHLHQNNRRDNIINEEGVLVTRWAAECRTAVMEAIYAVYTLNGFVRGSFTEMPPLGGTVEQRLANQYFPRFNGSAELIASDPDSRVVSLMLLPGGVVSQAYPIGPLGLDIMQGPISTTYPTPIDTAHRGEPTILGHTTNVYMPELTGEIIEVREPIYNRDVNLSTSQPLSSLWGFAVAILTVDSLIHNSIADRLVLRYQMDYLMYVNHTISDTERELIFVTSSLGESMSDEEMHEFIDTGSIRPVLPTRLNWYIAVRSRRSWRIVTSTVWVLITIGAVVLAIILATIATIAMLYITREYNGRRYAPKAAPFAVLTVGPARGEELWALASNQMVTVVDELMDVNHRFMKAHHSYQMVQLWPFTSSYVLPTVEEAVRMGFDILEELQKNPLDRHLRQLIGDDERLLLTCAVHWCTDATVTEDKVEDALLYAGPDVAYAGRMWVFSSPNTVTLSEAARACCCTESGPAINGWSLTPLSSVYLRGVPVLQELFTIMDENSRYQREAHVTALAVMEHRRRAREEQLLAERRHGNMWGGGEATAVSTTTTAMPSGSPTAVESATSTNSSFSGTPASVVVGRGGGTVFSPLQRKSRVVAAVKRTASSVQLRANNRITTSGEWGASLDDLRSDSDAGGVGGSTVMAHRTTAVVGAAATTVPGTQLITNVPTSATTIPTSGATSAIQEEPLPLVGSSSSAILPPPPLIRDELCAVEKVAPMHSMAISSPATATAHVVQGLTVTAPSLVLPDPSGGLLAHLDNPLELHDDADGWSPLSLRTPHGGLDDFSPLGAIMGPLPSFATDAADETEARVVVPSLPLWLDRILRTAFERQALTLPTSYDSVRILVFYFFTSYDLLFKPLTSMERTNVQRRLATAFGVPTQCITQHLAARCATRYLQQHQEITTGA